MSVQLTTLPELNRKAFDLLAKGLGLADTMRFFSQFGLGTGNYVEERRALFAGLTMEEYRQALATMPKEPAGSD